MKDEPRCDFCRQSHDVNTFTVNGVTLVSCPNVDRDKSYLVASRGQQHPDTRTMRDVVRQRDELIREREELRAQLVSMESRAVRAERGVIDERARCNDWIGDCQRARKDRDQAMVDCEFFRRELERERAKSRKRGL